jgi:phospholipase/carboxylesterase
MSEDTLEYIEYTTGPNPKYTVIWLHGLGADGNDFVPIIPELALNSDCRFIFPHAPLRPITCNQGQVMRGWYDIVHFDKINRQADIEGIRRSRTAIHTLIHQENARGIPTQHIILAGFSQGGAMVYMTGLTYPERFAGLIALSTYIPAESLLREEYHPANCQTPLFIGHGTRDPVVPIPLGQAAQQTITALGNPYVYFEYPMQHSVCAQEISDISAWLQPLIDPTYS